MQRSPSRRTSCKGGNIVGLATSDHGVAHVITRRAPPVRYRFEKSYMTPRDRQHITRPTICVSRRIHVIWVRSGGPRPPSPIRDQHAQRLIEEARQAELTALARRNATLRESGVTSTSEGMLVTFESWPGFELELSTLDPARQPPELVAVVQRVTDEGIVQKSNGTHTGWLAIAVSLQAVTNTPLRKLKGQTTQPKHGGENRTFVSLRIAGALD